jgi:hypothetical protein
MATSTDLRSALEEVRQGLPAEARPAEGLAPGFRPDWAAIIEERVGALPWWGISATVHAVLFLLIALLAVAAPVSEPDEVIIDSRFIREKPEFEQRVSRTSFEKTRPIAGEKVEHPRLVHEPDERTEPETANNLDDRTARGDPEAISDLPLGSLGYVGSIGVGPGGMAGAWGLRGKGGRIRAVGRGGGSEGSERAVERALAWLSRHQESDGHWDARKWEAGMRTDPGITGLALLAFLGAGYTEKEGKYRDHVRRAVNWICSKQEVSGRIGAGYEGAEKNGVGYHHAICGLALAEAYGMAGNAAVGAAAQKALNYSCGEHQIAGSGWRYTAKAAEDDPAGVGDLSVTGWFVMQLKSARMAELRVPATGMQGALSFLETVSDQYGRCRYQPSWVSPSPTMTSVGMLCRLFSGSPPGDPRVAGGAEYLMKSLPVWGENGSGVNMYYWYYGTLTTFQVGGEPWRKWNASLRDMLCEHQRTGGPLDGSAQDVDGSWDPVCTWAARGGRVYATALGALCLEVYYRYLPMYGG